MGRKNRPLAALAVSGHRFPSRLVWTSGLPLPLVNPAQVKK